MKNRKGEGTIFNGYRRLTVRENGRPRRVFEHVFVWEQEFGKIPSGYIVHHKNGQKLDNRIENLEIMTRSDHKRHHVGYRDINGVPHRPCKKCEKMTPLTEVYMKKNVNRRGDVSYFPSSLCIPCNNARNKEADRKTREKRGGKWNPRVGRNLYGPPAPRGPRRKISNGSLYLKEEIVKHEK